MIRVAAVGDVHFGEDSRGCLRGQLAELADHADVFLLAGDLTRRGTADEAKVLADELDGLDVPTFGVLGNHDLHADAADAVVEVLDGVGVTILEGEARTLTVGDETVGIAGVKGFGGGFAGASGSDFGEAEMKAFIRHTKAIAGRLGGALDALDTDHRVALLHYAPTKDTLEGEKLEIYPFLGSYLLGQAIDEVGADLVIHGHAHGGTERGMTAGGIHVRNVAEPVIRRSYRVYCLEGDAQAAA